MITSNTNKKREFNIAFTTAKEIPEEFIKDRMKPVKVSAKIDKKDTTIEIVDFLTMAFDGLPLLNMLIRTGTDFEADVIQKGLIKRYGNAIKSSMIYIISYRKAK